MSLIYKLLSGAEWDEARRLGRYEGSAVDRADGYIHFSTADQLAETARRHFSGQEGLVLLSVETEGLGAALVWEPSRGGQLFPHLYGVLPLNAVREERPVSLDSQGVPAIGAL